MVSFIHSQRRMIGLTLVELLTVLALLAIAVAIILPVIPGVSTRGLGIQCQLNLQAIYQAIKLYHLDYQGYPPFDTCSPQQSPPIGRGLLALYSFVEPDLQDDDGDGRVDEDPIDGVDNDGDGKIDEDPNYRRIRTGYLNSPSYLHCPLDRSQKLNADDDNDGKVDEEFFNFVDDDGDGKVDEDLKSAEYCSYQVSEDIVKDPGDAFTYLRTRTGNSADPDASRQLSRLCIDGVDKIPYFADDTTVITWCKHHRRTLKRGGSPADLVLFLDGHIKIMEAPQLGNNVVGWRRKP